MAIEIGRTPEEFKKAFLDPVSDSYCLAKWYEATMWLYIGHTASCHHIPTHKFDLDPKAPGSLHNTPIRYDIQIHFITHNALQKRTIR